MTDDLSNAEVRQRLIELDPDVVGCTAITPSIYKAEELLKVALDTCPNAVRVLGGVHATFMYKQVLSEAPWIDVIVRGEGEETICHLIKALEEGYPLDTVPGIAWRMEQIPSATRPAPLIRDLDSCRIGWELIDHVRYTYWGGLRAVLVQFSRGCPHQESG